MSLLNKKISGQSLNQDEIATVVKFLTFLNYCIDDLDKNISRKLFFDDISRIKIFVQPIAEKLEKLNELQKPISRKHTFNSILKLA